MCYAAFGVVCLVCSVVVFCVVSQNNKETAECGAGSAAGRSLRHCLHLNVNSYIYNFVHFKNLCTH